jgi:hypothetical protein
LVQIKSDVDLDGEKEFYVVLFGSLGYKKSELVLDGEKEFHVVYFWVSHFK